MEKTVVADWINTRKIGYWVGAILSSENQHKLTSLLSELKQELPDALWAMPTGQLHTTLFEIVMTFRDYDEDPDSLFARHRDSIDAELKAQLGSQGPITVHFNAIEASQNAIIVKGADDGSFQKIRNAVSDRRLLPAGTRTPPDIIHSSIARYVKPVDLAWVTEVVSVHSIDFFETINQFELARIWRMPMDHKTLTVYPLDK
jgi:hypothetical protein